MRVYVDESGDTGLNGDASSSSHFVVTAVVFACPQEAQKCSQNLDNLRKELGWQQDAEFKFSKLNPANRVKFLQSVSAFDFRYYSVILDKKKLDGKGFKFQKSFYKFPIRILFKNAKHFLKEAVVCVDQFRNDDFRIEVEKYLKIRINNSSSSSQPIKELIMADSRSDNLLQMVDVVCGVIGRSLKAEKTDHRDYRPLIMSKEAGFQKWPQKRRRRVITKKKTAKKTVRKNFKSS